MIDPVKYQLERAEDALRTAIKLGAETEDPYLLKNIAETINTVKGWRDSYRYQVTKETTSSGIKFDLQSTNSEVDEYSARYYGLDDQPYNYMSGIQGAAGKDVITFG